MNNTQPKRYFEYFYTYRMAESKMKQWQRNRRVTCTRPMITKAGVKKKWAVWYQKEKDPRIIPTSNARYYDK